MSDMTMISVKLDPETRRRLEALEVARHQPLQQLAREAIDQYLEREEAAESKSLDFLEAGEKREQADRFVAHDPMEAWLRTWGTPVR